MNIHASDREIPLLREHWEQTFGDGDDFLGPFFQAYPPERYCFVSRAGNGEPKGLLFLLPAQIFREGAWREARYLYGVCTLPQYRRQGVFRQLFAAAAEEARHDGAEAIFSLPSDERSRAAHRSLGFVSVYAQREIVLDRARLECLRRLRMAPMPLAPLSAAEYFSRRNARPAELLTRLTGDYPAADFLAFGGLYLGGSQGFAAVKQMGKRLVVKETDLDPSELAFALAHRFDPEEITLCLPPDVEFDAFDWTSSRTVDTAVLYPLAFSIEGSPRAFTSGLLED